MDLNAYELAFSPVLFHHTQSYIIHTLSVLTCVLWSASCYMHFDYCILLLPMFTSSLQCCFWLECDRYWSPLKLLYHLYIAMTWCQQWLLSCLGLATVHWDWAKGAQSELNAASEMWCNPMEWLSRDAECRVQPIHGRMLMSTVSKAADRVSCSRTVWWPASAALCKAFSIFSNAVSFERWCW